METHMITFCFLYLYLKSLTGRQLNEHIRNANVIKKVFVMAYVEKGKKTQSNDKAMEKQLPMCSGRLSSEKPKFGMADYKKFD
eukprot:CAMPEP_0184488618 /NCGR_PEP_ID=MMETSP0113_2-20130426/12750_1 /TAXON_ID=91329 /ORGANISM="Norrisiella sphaerica, Strain BC52" /LENGTH=82 /DNA_ID=CAMNT_0026871523 /DNA_START=113 /DNA_END=358 /DNA_ORIENTATION=+